MAAAESTAAVLARLCACLQLDDHVAAKCAAAFRAPNAALFALPTAQLSRILRLLKNAAASEQRSAVEQHYMALVTSVS